MRELYKMVRHNPEIVNARKKVEKPKAPAVQVLDLEELRQSVVSSVFVKGGRLWTNEVPKTVQSQLEKGRANPTIGFSIL